MVNDAHTSRIDGLLHCGLYYDMVKYLKDKKLDMPTSSDSDIAITRGSCPLLFLIIMPFPN